MALVYAGISLELREVLLRDKPAAMLVASTKGTVPVLVLADGAVIDESIDVMHWALDIADPADWRSAPRTGDTPGWIERNDGPFKAALDRYKYADRHPQQPASAYRDEAAEYLADLDAALQQQSFIHGEHPGFVDVALFPFIRQFAMVDRDWFADCPYGALRSWLEGWLEHPLFHAVMRKYPRWEPGQTPVLLAAAD
jgi:glutathione S-transferase